MANQAKATYAGGISFDIEIRGHKLTADLPRDKGGNDRGPTPPELLVAALASCVGIFAAMFAQRNGLSPEGIEVEARAETAQSPMRLTDFSAVLRFPSLPAELKDKARAFIESCLVGNTLKRANPVSLEFEA